MELNKLKIISGSAMLILIYYKKKNLKLQK